MLEIGKTTEQIIMEKLLIKMVLIIMKCGIVKKRDDDKLI